MKISAMLTRSVFAAILAMLTFGARCTGIDWKAGGSNTFDNENEIVDVDFNSSFCSNFMTYSAKICDYANTSKTIRLKGKYPSVLEVRIKNAKRLLFYQSCTPWTFVKNVDYFTTLPSTSDQEQDCSTWLTISNSKVDTLTFGIHDVSVLNSTVQTILLRNQRDFKLQNTTVEHLAYLSWEGYMAEILLCAIRKISHISSSEHLFIQHSSVGSIKAEAVHIKHSYLLLNNSNIKTIESYGVTVTSGKLSLNNVTIETLYQDALKIDDITEVTLRNVRIFYGYFPVFFFPITENVILENVTIAGEVVTHISKWIRTSENAEIRPMVSSKEESKHCFTETYTMKCNFSGMPQLEFEMDLISEKHRSLVISNANLWKFSTPPCHLKNIKIIDSSMITLLISNYSDNCVSKLEMENSNVTYLYTSAVQNIELRECQIQSLYVENVSNFTFLSSATYNYMYLATEVNSSCFISDSRITTFNLGNINGNLQIQESVINHMENVTLASTGGISKFSQVDIKSLILRGLKMNVGHLEMVDVSFSELRQQSIFLERNASISIHGDSEIPNSGLGFISLINENQANITTQKIHFPLERYYTVRKIWPILETFSDGTAIDLVFNGTSAKSTYCRKYWKIIKCDYSNITNATVNVKFLYNHYEEVHMISDTWLTLENIGFLQLNSTAFKAGRISMVDLSSVHNGTIYLSKDDGNLVFFPTWSLQDSSLLLFNSYLGSLKMVNSSIAHFEPIIIYKDQCAAFAERSYISVVNNLVCQYFNATYSVIDVVQEIISTEFKMYNSQIGLVETMSIIVEDAHNDINSTLTNVTVHKIKTKGITVLGELYIVNCSIEYAEDYAFDVFGNLTLENVDIKNGSTNIFFLRKGSGFGLTNVKINGKYVELSRTIDFVEDANATAAKLTPTQKSVDVKEYDPTTDDSAYFKLTSSVVVVETDSNGTLSAIHENLEKDDTADLTWLGSVLGFFLGACCAVMVLYALLIFRPNTKIAMPAIIRWRARDDDQLIPSDEEEMSERGMNSLT